MTLLQKTLETQRSKLKSGKSQFIQSVAALTEEFDKHAAEHERCAGQRHKLTEQLSKAQSEQRQLVAGRDAVWLAEQARAEQDAASNELNKCAQPP